VHLGFTFYCQPHKSRVHNVVDMWLQVQLILVILFALTNIVSQTGPSPFLSPPSISLFGLLYLSPFLSPGLSPFTSIPLYPDPFLAF